MSTEDQISLEDADALLLEMHNKTAPEPAAPVVEEGEEEATLLEEEKVTPEEAEPAQPVEEDWLSQIPETVRDKVQAEIEKRAALEHRVASDSGRVAAFQRKYEDLKRQMAQPQRPVKVPETPATPEEWQQVLDHDPVLAKAIEARVRSEAEQLRKEFEQQVLPLNAREEQRYIEQELQLLDQAVPDWRDIRNSEMFIGWLENECPPFMKEAAQSSKDHREVLAVLNQFAVEMITTGRVAPVQAVTTSAPAAPAAPQIDPQRASAIAAQRVQRLAQTAVGGKAPAIAVAKDPNAPITIEDMDAMLIEMYKKNHKSG